MVTAKNEQEDRVKQATPNSINEKIENETWSQVAYYVGKDKAEITGRIQKVDKEWDIERYLGVNMSTLAILGVALAYFVHSNWLLLPAIVLLFFFQHSVQGWCPPLPILRLFKIRTGKEIEQEKYALKILRGDFDQVNSQAAQVENVKQAVGKT